MKNLMVIVLVVVMVSPFIWNIVKFTSCDFNTPLKCEVIHGIGVFVPPAAYITVWFDDDGS